MNTPTPRTDAQAGWAIANVYGQSTAHELLGDPKGAFVHSVFARTLERELAALTAKLTVALANWNGALERALKAEAEVERTDAIYQRACEVEHELRAELAKERARLDWLESDAGVDWQWSSSALTIRRAVIDAAMKEGSA